ncbi:MAG: ASPIC/UnbV domain-containing protein, partial [Flavobacteriales bacterium]|nr:ASPIC/UnbV domain-containing protein [Flavobacteriales bacterium]
NDGDIDLFASTWTGVNHLYENQGNGTFTNVTGEIVVNDVNFESFAATWADFDRDGDLDLYVANSYGAANSFFYSNNGNANHWIDVKCVGTITNTSAIGARVFVTATINGNPVSQMREISPGSGRAAGNPLNTHFGLGDATIIDVLEIVWPTSGITQTFTNVAIDQFIEITEGVNLIDPVADCIPDLSPENPGFVTGTVFKDDDDNCVFNPLVDGPIANRIIQATPGPYFVFSDNQGDYEFRLSDGTYNITQATIQNDLWKTQPCQNSVLSANVTNGQTTAGNNFADEIEPLNNHPCGVTLQLNSIPFLADSCTSPDVLQGPCPGVNHRYCLTIRNDGQNAFLPIPPGSDFQLTLDPGMTFLSEVSNPCGLDFNSGTQTWTIDDATQMPPGTICTVCIEVRTDVFVNPGWTTTAIASVQCGMGNDAIVNAEAIDTTRCPCDPNDKLVSPVGCGPFGNIEPGEALTYRVRFQNIGGTPATDVIIRDVLDNDLDITSLQILASSHTVTHVEIIPGNALIISFEGINLPDSASDPLGSNGYVTFSIQPKENLPDGAEITNQAGIYFDFNDVVLTNTTLNTIRDNPFPVADFESSRSCTSAGFEFDFTYPGNTSDGAEFMWDFGQDATPSVSTDENPTGIVYSSTGARDVTLTVTRFGCEATVTKVINVEDVTCGNNKVLICHIPPGNPNHPRTLCVNSNTIAAHLAHGDCLGPCNTPLARLAPTKEDDNQSVEPEIVLEKRNLLKVYPNPNTGQFVVETSNIGGLLSVTDILGKKVWEGQISSNRTELDLVQHGTGVYFVKFQSGGEIEVMKVICQ